MEFHFLKKTFSINKSTIAIIVYVVGLIICALILDLWSHETGLKAFIGMIWTLLFLIALFFCDKNEKK